MARLEPSPTAVSDAFWDATRVERYLVQWCSECNAPIFYPREICPSCLSSDTLVWKTSNGTGTVHAVSVQHRPAYPQLADRVPYAVALVEMDAGEPDAVVRVMSNVVNCDPSTVQVDDQVRLVWEPLSDGRNLPLFEPVDRSA